MGNARPLVEFNQFGWIQVDFAPLINYRRKEERHHVAKLVEDIFDKERVENRSKRYLKKKEKKMMKDGSINLTTRRFAMKEERNTTVMSLVTRRINGRR
jgi:DNA recombination-dependent growth factor C